MDISIGLLIFGGIVLACGLGMTMADDRPDGPMRTGTTR